MEVTALCVRLLMTVLFLLCALDQKVDSLFLLVDPNRLQFFEYDRITFHCEGLKGEVSSCRSSNMTSMKSCSISTAFPEDSGEYWCEAGGGERSNSVSITVTTGSVILESPALPVMEGETVTLRCSNKLSSSSLPADFYKGGAFIKSSSTGEMTIHSVSKSDEGLYKCSISGAADSPESWLAVRVSTEQNNPTTPWIIVTLLLTLLLAVGLLHLGKGYWLRVSLLLSTLTRRPGSAEDHTASVAASAADADKVTYAVVTKKRKKKDDEFLPGPVYYTLGHEPWAGPNPSTEEAVYSEIQVAE